MVGDSRWRPDRNRRAPKALARRRAAPNVILISSLYYGSLQRRVLSWLLRLSSAGRREARRGTARPIELVPQDTLGFLCLQAGAAGKPAIRNLCRISK